MEYPISPPTLRIKIIILIALIKLDVLGDLWIDVPSFLLVLYAGLVVVVNPRQHPLLIQTFGPM